MGIFKFFNMRQALILILTATLTPTVYGLTHYNMFPNFNKVPQPEIEIIEEGEGELIPVGAHVQVHFELFDENGEKVESSRDKEMPMEFVAGLRHINLRGFDDHIIEMRKGQRSLLTLPPELAFGVSRYGHK